MLKQLRELHEQTAALIAKLDSLCCGPKPDAEILAPLRWRLTQASAQRHKLLEQVVYPHLLSRGSPGVRLAVQQLSEDGRVRRARSALHVREWDLTRALEEWEVYTERSATIRAGMMARIHEEQELLVPILELAGPHDAYGVAKQAALRRSQARAAGTLCLISSGAARDTSIEGRKSSRALQPCGAPYQWIEAVDAPR